MNEVNNNGNTPVNPGAMSFNVPPTEPSMPAGTPATPQPAPVPNNVNPTPAANPSNVTLQSALSTSASEMNNAAPVNNPGVAQPAPVQQPAPETTNVSLGTVVNNGVTMSEPIPAPTDGAGITPPSNGVTLDANPLPTEVPAGNIEEEKPVKEKKKTSPIVIIALILVLLVGAAAGYYFLIETPKMIFGTAYDKFLSEVKETQNFNDSHLNYELKLGINSEDETFKTYSDIINNISISGTSGYNKNTKSFESNNMITYKDKELLNMSLLVNEKNAYLKLNNLLDKVIKVSTESSGTAASTVDTDINDYIDIEEATLLNLKQTLEKATYKKELVELNGSRVTKSTLYLDKDFINSYYNGLLGNASYLEKYAKVTGTTVDAVKEELNKSMNEYKNNDEKISIYTSLIKNELLKLEIIGSKDNVVVTKADNKYNYEYTEDGKAVYNGSFSTSKIADETNVSVTVNMIEEKSSFTVNATYSKIADFEALDTSSAVDINGLTEEDMTKLENALKNNAAYKELLKDLDMEEYGDALLESMI